jgi:hypothetical protein
MTVRSSNPLAGVGRSANAPRSIVRREGSVIPGGRGAQERGVALMCRLLDVGESSGAHGYRLGCALAPVFCRLLIVAIAVSTRF